jgi:phospholipid/cholesterol/gamma-HCH transport system ATP-binding protein
MSASAIEIRAEALGKSFGSHVVLRDIELTVRSGELVAIVGGSGSGKTVLLDHLVGLLRPDAGRILAADHSAPLDEGPDAEAPLVDLGRLDGDALDRVRLHWAVVFQRNALFSGTVGDNIALWLREHAGLDEGEITRRVRASLAAVALDVDDTVGKERDALSGGMAKRVAIARAIAADPVVLFYDEPTTGLDPVIAGHIHELIWDQHRRAAGPGPGEAPRRTGLPRTTILVTHDRELLRRLRPRVVMLDRARVCYDGPYDGFGQDDCVAARQYLAIMPALNATPNRPKP